MSRRLVTPLALGLAVLAASAIPAQADDRGRAPVSVTVSFGVGLNTAQPGNAQNHHVLPRVITVRKGGVVNFVVAGFHHVFVYRPGTEVEQVTAAADALPAGTLFINYTENTLYQGISPTTPVAGLSNAQNRVESVGFLERGTYLVICNVLPHFRDGMIAYVRVVGDGDGGDDHEEHGQD